MDNNKTCGKYVVIFDGDCHFCNSTVRFIIDRDKNDKFLFASLQSDFGQSVAAQFGLPANNFKTFLLLIDDKIYTKSTAGFKVLQELGPLYRFVSLFRWLPRFLTDAVYMLVSNNRKIISGNASCQLPTQQVRAKFIN